MAAAEWWEALVAAAAVGGTAGSSTTVVSICVFTAVLCLCLVAGHLLEENKWVNESITALIIGCLIGAIIFLLTKGKQSHILRFDEQLFFIYVLPPIIFNAGFQVKKKQFFHNFMTIMSFGVFGVFISVAIVSAGCYWLFPKVGFGKLDASDYLVSTDLIDNSALGAIFSSTDTVCTLQVINQDETPRLYSLVFGEGVVNDATAVVLFNAIKNLNISHLKGEVVLKVISDFLYLFATSTILGISMSLSTAYVLKALYLGRHSTDREVALMALMAYLSYMLAELLDLSGILTVFFCGIVMSHYAWHNVTASSRITTKHIFATLSFIAETFIFLYVGMDALDIDKWKTSKASFKTSISIFGIIILLVLLGRAAFVYPISILSNNMSGSSERTPITFKHQVVIWWAGLMRGAVSIALAYNQFTFSGVTSDPVHATIITSTIIIVFFTTLVFGFLTRPLISTMLPRHSRALSRGHSTGSNSPNDDFTLPFFSTDEDASGSGIVLEQAKRSISLLLERPVHTVHIYWRKFDDKFMRPIFGGPQSH
ncbi:sodium/hydrogen exchanger 4 [Panicum miliaceum]|uniref:Sodium/hydrogen exchanger 4 n=1 Tax=Panicum miliaceum TaxID=4540 RepID=A0A3L6PBP3_PANMI|nr:sodium/hydrogen exchanger 4 [Panicum miliaceum]